MNILPALKSRFRLALAGFLDDTAEIEKGLDLIRRSQDPKFGDYQANMAMPLGKKLGRPPREVAAEIIARLETRTVQSTYVERCRVLAPALSVVAEEAGEPLNLIEIGTASLTACSSCSLSLSASAARFCSVTS